MTTQTAPLFEPLRVGPLTLAHRVVMAPLTRMRATVPGCAPNEANARYYGQRASRGGLIIAEASQVLPGGRPAPSTPGCHTDDQVAGWAGIVKAIHEKGGYVFLQLWHVGRLSHSSYQPDGQAPFSASPIRIEGKARTAGGPLADYETPREIPTEGIATFIEAYAQATRNAMAAGFDGVEIHGANGYLLEQFLQPRSNQRTDAWGGSVQNRMRLLLEVTQAAAAVAGADRVGVRLSPFGVANGSGDDNPEPLYREVIRALDPLGLAYLHLIEPRASGAGQREVDHQNVPSAAVMYRRDWRGPLIAAGNFKADTAASLIAQGDADAIAFGRYFISNPDLPERIRVGAAFTPYNRATFYTQGEEGYTDYPTLADSR